MYIFSKKNKARLIACIYKVKKTMPSRIDLSPSNELLQAGIIKLNQVYIV